MSKFRSKRALAGAAGLAAGASVLFAASGGGATFADEPAVATTATPIQHLVVIFQENVSFDHYFGTYPNAANIPGEQQFTPAAGTPAVNGLTPQLLTNNPNGVNPKRYDPTNVNDVLTCDQDHNYSDEQKAFDLGNMDQFPQTVGNKNGKTPESTSTNSVPCNPNDVMNYYDGNTVTALWNYAQHYSMSDANYNTTFGPSSPGAINLASGNTGNVDTAHTANSPSVASSTSPNADLTPDGTTPNGTSYSLTSDAQPYWDDCSTRDAVAMKGTNIGDELNSKHLSWGWFQGGFRPTTSFTTAAAAVGQPNQPTSQFTPDEFSGKFNDASQHQANQGICNAVHPVGAGLTAPLTPGTGQYGWKDDYIAHHEPFQYYASTANPHHLTLPTDGNGHDTLTGLRTVGTDTQSYSNGAPQFNTPNHNYDTSDFDQLVSAIHNGSLPSSALPAVSFLKAPGYQDGHAAYSDPIDEQQFIVNEINALQQTPDWKNTAVVISYDDSDGWYDHAYSGVTNPSQSVADALTGPGLCGRSTPIANEQGRCGYGPRLPLLVISPWSAPNHVDHTVTSQTSITKFIEDNWGLPRIPGSFDEVTGSLNGLFAFGQSQANSEDHGNGQANGNGRGEDNQGRGEGHAYGTAPDHQTYLLNPDTGQPLS